MRWATTIRECLLRLFSICLVGVCICLVYHIHLEDVARDSKRKIDVKIEKEDLDTLISNSIGKKLSSIQYENSGCAKITLEDGTIFRVYSCSHHTAGSHIGISGKKP
jgi:hypothetical protein